MSKRRNVNGQMRKEEYEALQDDDESGGLQEGFQTASVDVLKKRRIVRVSNRSRFSKGGPVRAPTSASSTKPLTSASRTTSTPAIKKNPFASVSFASATPSGSISAGGHPPPQTPRFSFGASNPAFATSTITPSRSTPHNAPMITSTLVPTSSLQQQTQQGEGGGGAAEMKLSETETLNLAMLRMGQMDRRANPFSDYSKWLKVYLSKMESLLQAKDDDESAATSTTPKTTTTASATTTTTTTSTLKPFSFANTTSSSSPTITSPSKLVSFAQSQPSTTSTITTTTSTSPTKPTLSFGNPASSTRAPAKQQPPTFPKTTTNTSNTTQESISSTTTTTTGTNDKTEVEHAPNEDEEELYTVRAKYRKLHEGEWKSYAAGVLRLYRHKVHGKCRVDIRNDIGKVQLSLALPKGMALQKVPAKGSGCVMFHSIQSEEEGMKSFGLVVKKEHLDTLYDTMKDMTAN